MTYVLTLACPSAAIDASVHTGAFDPASELARAARAAATAVGAAVGDVSWLRPGSACDLPIGHPEPSEVDAAVRHALAGAVVDVALQPTTGRRKRLLVADMESTVIENEMLDELAALAGVEAKVVEITARAMNGELDFRQALDERVSLLRGMARESVLGCLPLMRIDPGARSLVSTLRADGAYCTLVSGGFTLFADRIAEQLGFDSVRANTLAWVDASSGTVLGASVLKGTVNEPILDRDAKVAALDEYVVELGLTRQQAVTVGDGANDLPMLQAAGLGVAYHGKPAVAAAAAYRIDHGDLSTLLDFLGYRADERA